MKLARKNCRDFFKSRSCCEVLAHRLSHNLIGFRPHTFMRTRPVNKKHLSAIATKPCRFREYAFAVISAVENIRNDDKVRDAIAQWYSLYLFDISVNGSNI